MSAVDYGHAAVALKSGHSPLGPPHGTPSPKPGIRNIPKWCPTVFHIGAYDGNASRLVLSSSDGLSFGHLGTSLPASLIITLLAKV